MAKYFATEAAQENALDCMRDPRRLRLLARVPARALLPRRAAAPDRRGLERDPAADHRAAAARAARRLTWTSRAPPELAEIRAAVRELCARFPGEYWRGARARPLPGGVRRGADRERLARGADPGGVRRRRALAHGGERDPGGDQRLRRATRAPATRRCTRWARSCGTAPRSRSSATCRGSPSGELRLQAFGVTEPTAGSDTTAIQTTADEGRRRLGRSTARRSGRRAPSTPT